MTSKAFDEGFAMNNDLMFSSKTGKWDTPQSVIDDLATVFDWDLDVCASRANVCENYYTEGDDGLTKRWRGLCWMNPPYGRAINVWVNKARIFGTGAHGVEGCKAVVCLLPSRTDTLWWQNNIDDASLVVFIKGRLKFGGAKNSAPFPSAFVVFGKITPVQAEKLASYGWSIDTAPAIC